MEIVTGLDRDFLKTMLKAYRTVANASPNPIYGHLNSYPQDETQQLPRFRVIRDVILECSAMEETVTHSELVYAMKLHGWDNGVGVQISMMLKHEYLVYEKDGTLGIGPVPIPDS